MKPLGGLLRGGSFRGGKTTDMNIDLFLDIEKKYGLVTDTVDGYAYWTYARFFLKKMLLEGLGYGDAHVEPKFSRKRQFCTRLNMIKNSIQFSRRIKGKRDILFLNHERRAWINSHYECIYTDRLARLYPKSIVLERPYLQGHFRPVETEQYIYTDYIEVKASIYLALGKMLFKKRKKRVRNIIYNRIYKPIEEICNAYNFHYNVERVVEEMMNGYFVYQVKKREYEKIIKKYRPKLIVEVVGYSFDCMIINEISVEEKIPSIELQHGTTGREHLNYNYPGGIYVKQFPQFFFAFSEYWIKTTRFPLPDSHLKAVGFPYLEEKAKEAKKNAVKENMSIIIFISQSPIGYVLSDIAVELNNLIDHKKYRIIYKLHPGEYERWKERYKRLAASDVMVIDNNHSDLYTLFAASSIQVGAFSSTAIFEGLYFQLRTFILRDKASIDLQELCEQGVASFFDTSEELYQKIEMNYETVRGNVTFWKENAIENITVELDKMLLENGKEP